MDHFNDETLVTWPIEISVYILAIGLNCVTSTFQVYRVQDTTNILINYLPCVWIPRAYIQTIHYIHDGHAEYIPWNIDID